MERQALARLELFPDEITANRKSVRSQLIARSPNVVGAEITRLAPSDLRLLFDLYDAVFFQGSLGQHLGDRLGFSLSTRMTRSAGQVVFSRNFASLGPNERKLELRLGIDLFTTYYATDRLKVVNGIPTADALEALQLVFEHELCHLIELVAFGKTSCRGQNFKTMARRIFGHTGTYHQLPTRQELAGSQFGLKVGDGVSFTHGHIRLSGVIYRINKRATVMVPDPGGDYRDAQGWRYRKWHVPLHLLEKR